jgi:predicted anti-sigma-YlaC factor YlaD
MHRSIEDHLEEILAGSTDGEIEAHLKVCSECRDEVAQMRAHSIDLQSLRSPEQISPAPGFYARVAQRVEQERRSSMWNLFLEPAFGRRIAFASIALAALMGLYLVSSEQSVEMTDVAVQLAVDEAQPVVAVDRQPDPDQVLVSLASYREE